MVRIVRRAASTTEIHKDDWAPFTYMGGTGYDRDVDLAAAPGTPGYANINVNVVSDDKGHQMSQLTTMRSAALSPSAKLCMMPVLAGISSSGSNSTTVP